MQRSASRPDRLPARLMPAGQRWGFGARTVLPYLHHSQARMLAPDIAVHEAGPVRNPVFADMGANTATGPPAH